MKKVKKVKKVNKVNKVNKVRRRRQRTWFSEFCMNKCGSAYSTCPPNQRSPERVQRCLGTRRHPSAMRRSLQEALAARECLLVGEGKCGGRAQPRGSDALAHGEFCDGL